MKSIVDFIEQRSMLSHSENINEKQQFLIKGHTIDQSGAVDLSLPSGTKWATCNIGANKPEDYGLLFQFGKIDGYKYGDKKHKFLSEDDYFTTSGTKYKKGDTIKRKDDAVYQATRGKFRIPTVDEIDELIKYTDNEWTELNGVNGRKFISKKDKSKWIFIPAAGYFYGYYGKFYNSGSVGCVWASSVNAGNSYCGDCLFFNAGDCERHYDRRDDCISVRGVCK